MLTTPLMQDPDKMVQGLCQWNYRNVTGWDALDERGVRDASNAIAIIAAAITSAAATDLPEISLMGTLLLWDEGGIAFGDLTFWNRPLLGTATAIVVDCQFLDRDGQKVDQRKLTVEGPVYGRTIKTVRVRIGTLSENADTMACSVVDFKWVSWQQ
jgi:hypothetical protein